MAGFTASSDGTSIKHIDHISRNIIVNAPDYDTDSSVFTPCRRFLGISTAINHTSETQLDGWTDIFVDISKLFNNSPLRLSRNVNLSDEILWTKILGYMGDHSEDQNKLSRLAKQKKAASVRHLLGQQALENMSETQRQSMLSTATTQAIVSVGVDTWGYLGEEAKKSHCEIALREMRQSLGESAYNSLSPSNKGRIDLFIRAGCGSHKELNGFKGFCTGMTKFWLETDVEGPVKLMNKANAAAAAADSGLSEAAQRAFAVSNGGVVKLASLAGALFANKDKKKGQQDTYRIFFWNKLSYDVPFPGTSSVRYQSFYKASAVLIKYRHLYLEFLDLVAMKKESGSLNHLEGNVKKGLEDLPTLKEMCSSILYAQSIGHPYSRKIHEFTNNMTNALDLGPFHHSVTAFISRLIENPSLILAPDANCKTGALDGLGWEDPEAYYAAKALLKDFDMSIFESLFVSGLKSALETWKRFTSEFITGIVIYTDSTLLICESGGLIDSLSKEDRELVFLMPTNDINEGSLGERRQTSVRSPNLSNTQHNARKMFRYNNTAAWMRRHLNSSGHKHIRKVARSIDCSGNTYKSKRKQAEYDRATADLKRHQHSARKEKKQKELNYMQSITLLSADELQVPGVEGKYSNEALKKQLSWYRKIAGDKSIPAYSSLSKTHLIQEVIKAIERHATQEATQVEERGNDVAERGEEEEDSGDDDIT